jgi:hypothetical protein
LLARSGCALIGVMSPGEITPITAARKVPPVVSVIAPRCDEKSTRGGAAAAVERARYGFGHRLTRLLDVLTTVFLSRYARRPMHVFGSMGVLLLLIGSGTLLSLAVVKLVVGAAMDPRSLVIVGAVSLIAGLQLMLTGLVAEMLSRLAADAVARRWEADTDRVRAVR